MQLQLQVPINQNHLTLCGPSLAHTLNNVGNSGRFGVNNEIQHLEWIAFSANRARLGRKTEILCPMGSYCDLDEYAEKYIQVFQVLILKLSGTNGVKVTVEAFGDKTVLITVHPKPKVKKKSSEPRQKDFPPGHGIGSDT